MCIIVAKYFDGIGWAGAKNRDRNYTPKLDFIEDEQDGTDRMMMHLHPQHLLPILVPDHLF